jgi:periplasmic protein TonB
MRSGELGRRRASGVAEAVVIVAIIILLLAAVGVWYFLIRTPESAVQAQITIPAVAPAPANVSAEIKPPTAAETLAALSIDQLFDHAKTAVNEQRLIAPASNNAIEFYLKILEKDPANRRAKDALLELVGFVDTAVQQQIAERKLDDAERAIALLATADPGNYTVTILRAKLDTQRKLVDRETQQARANEEASAKRAAEAAAARAAPVADPEVAPKSRAAATATEPRRAAATPTPALSSATSTVQPTTEAPKPAVPEPAPTRAAEAASDSTEPQVLQRVAAKYPPIAGRQRLEGWVQVELTVGTDGNVSNARVLQSEPPEVFDKAALEAARKWKFKPATRGGQPVQATAQQRIVFKM